MSGTQTQREYDVVVLGATGEWTLARGGGRGREGKSIHARTRDARLTTLTLWHACWAGFTGTLVAEYLSRHPTQPRWAIAGRSAGRLQALVDKLKLSSSVGVLSADTSDVASLQQVTKRTRVLINIAGPFRKTNGYEVAKACASVGTHYTDLSGESGFNQSLLACVHALWRPPSRTCFDMGVAHANHLSSRLSFRLSSLAASTGSILVPSAGFDSLPLDLAAYFAAQHLKHSQGVSHVDTVSTGVHLDGGFSTGTILSAVDAAEIDGGQLQFSQPDQLSPGECNSPSSLSLSLGCLAMCAAQPQSFVRPSSPSPAPAPLPPPPTTAMHVVVKGTHIMPFDLALPLPQFGTNAYGAWFPLTPHNHRIVNQTWGLLQTHAPSSEAYGQDFAYHEGSVLFPPKRVPWPLSYLLTSFLSLFFLANIKALIHLAPVRWALRTFLPTNYGPSKKGFADVRALASGKDASNSVRQSTCRITMQDSPGEKHSERERRPPWRCGAVCYRLVREDRPELVMLIPIPPLHALSLARPLSLLVASGYHATARLISETALHLASTHPATTQQSSVGGLRAHNFKGGILTTATIGAESLRQRLQQYAGLTFQVDKFQLSSAAAAQGAGKSKTKSKSKDL